MIDLWQHQKKAAQEVKGFWSRGGTAALAWMAVGTGKSFVAAAMAHDMPPGSKTICITPTRELVGQNANAALRLWPRGNIAEHCEGRGGRRDVDGDYIVGSIASLHQTGAAAFGRIDAIVADEAHLIQPGPMEGMYRGFIDKARALNPGLKVVGLTATPFRAKTGKIDAGPGALFEETVYKFGILDGIEAGILAPLRSKGAVVKIETRGVPVRRGEFDEQALFRNASGREIIAAACDEIVREGRHRRSWMAFCINVDHARLVAAGLEARGIATGLMLGETKEAERDAIVAGFKAGAIRCLVGVDVFATGYDEPATDLIAILRPTHSFVRYMQMKGRGVRRSSETGKQDCLILDYGRNAERHGLDEEPAPIGEKRARESADREPAAIECPACATHNSPRAFICSACGEILPGAVRHDPIAAEIEAIFGVTRTIHRVAKASPMLVDVAPAVGSLALQIEYDLEGGCRASQIVCFGAPDGGPTRMQAEDVWRSMFNGRSAAPHSAGDAVVALRSGRAAFPQHVFMISHGGHAGYVPNEAVTPA